MKRRALNWMGLVLMGASVVVGHTMSKRASDRSAQTLPTSPPLFGFAIEGLPKSSAELIALGTATGIRPSLVNFFLQWPEDPAAGILPAAALDAIEGAGAVAVLTWEPMYYRKADGAETAVAATRILAGEYDRYLDAMAQLFAQRRAPVIVRFAHEMNLQRYHWGTNAPAYGPESPELYRRMWRHVVGRFRLAGAQRVLWAFVPNADSIPGPGSSPAARWNCATAYYPGDEWVDLLGMDGYNWGDTQTPPQQSWQSHWQRFDEVFAGLRRELMTLSPHKVIVVFETASATSGGDKAAWLRDMATTAQDWRLGAVIWFEVNKEIDWRLRAGPSGIKIPDWAGTPRSAAETVLSWKQR